MLKGCSALKQISTRSFNVEETSGFVTKSGLLIAWESKTFDEPSKGLPR